MITAVQIRAARVMLGLDQRMLAERAGLSLPTIQRMESSTGLVRGHVDSLTRVIAALESAGIEFIAEGAASPMGGWGIRMRPGSQRSRESRRAVRSASRAM